MQAGIPVATVAGMRLTIDRRGSVFRNYLRQFAVRWYLVLAKMTID